MVESILFTKEEDEREEEADNDIVRRNGSGSPKHPIR